MYRGSKQWSCGRTMVLYASSRTDVCLVWMFLLIKPSDLLAFELIVYKVNPLYNVFFFFFFFVLMNNKFSFLKGGLA